MGTVAVVLWEYDANWVGIYRREAEVLRGVLTPLLLEVHHIGSTAVVGMTAKPVVDMLGVVRDIEAMEGYRAALAGEGYVWNGENGIAGRRYFDKWSPESPMEVVHLHVFAAGHLAISNHLRFRDYLREHPEAAAEYSRLKVELQRQFPLDRRAYTEGKHPFIERALKLAQETLKG